MRLEQETTQARRTRSRIGRAVLIALLCGLGAQSASAQVSAAICIRNDIRNNECVTSWSGPAPLAVFFDGWRNSSHSNPTTQSQRYTDLTYLWNFDDVEENFAYGERGSKNRMTGPQQGHVYDTPGTYTVTLRVLDAAGNSSEATAVVTVDDPDVYWGGTDTVCVSRDAGFPGCPAGAATLQTNDSIATLMWNEVVGNGRRRVLLEGGDTFSFGGTPVMDAAAMPAGPKLLGSYGGRATINGNGGGEFQLADDSGNEWRVAGIDFTGRFEHIVATGGGDIGAKNVLFHDLTYTSLELMAGMPLWADKQGPANAIENMNLNYFFSEVDIADFDTSNGGRMCTFWAVNGLWIGGTNIPNCFGGEHTMRQGGMNHVYTNDDIGGQGGDGKVMLRLMITMENACLSANSAGCNQPMDQILIQGTDFNDCTIGQAMLLASYNTGTPASAPLRNAIVERNLINPAYSGRSCREHVSIGGTQENNNIAIRQNMMNMGADPAAGYMSGTSFSRLTNNNPNAVAWGNRFYEPLGSGVNDFQPIDPAQTAIHNNLVWAPNLPGISRISYASPLDPDNSDNADNGDYGSVAPTNGQERLTSCPYQSCRSFGTPMSRADFALKAGAVAFELGPTSPEDFLYPNGGKAVACSASPGSPLDPQAPFSLTANALGITDPDPSSYRFDCNGDGVRQSCAAEGGSGSGSSCQCPGLDPGGHSLSCQVDDLGTEGPWTASLPLTVNSPSVSCSETHGGSVLAGDPLTLLATPASFGSVDPAAYRFDMDGNGSFGSCAAEGGVLGACNASSCSCSISSLVASGYTLGCSADSSPASGPYTQTTFATVREPASLAPVAAACSDDFSTNSIAAGAWASEGGPGWSISGGQLNVGVTAGSQKVLRRLDCRPPGPDTCQSMRLVADSGTNQSSGFIFRNTGGATDDPSNPGYYVVAASFEQGGRWYWLSYDGSGFVGFESNDTPHASGNGDYVGACLYGADDQIEVAVYEFGPTAPPADQSLWGAPTAVLGPATVLKLNAQGEVGVRMYNYEASPAAAFDDWLALEYDPSGSSGGGGIANNPPDPPSTPPTPGKPGTPTLILQ